MMATALDPAVQLWIDHTPLAIAFFDLDMRYIMASQRWRQDYQLGEQPLVGRSHYEVFPEISPEWKLIHQRCLRGERDCCEEAPFPRADGTVDWLRWDVHPWRDQNGEIGGIVMITEVITAQKEATQAIAQRTARLQQEATERAAEVNGFFNLTLDLLCIAGFDGYFKRLNPVFETLLGYTQDEMIAQPFMHLIHPDDHASTLQHAARLAQGDGVVAFENRYRCKDGSYRWLAWTSFPDVERQLIYATARDVTDLKAQEAILRHQAQVLDQVKGAIVATDLQGRITRWSRGAEALYGYGAEVALGQPISFLYDPADQSAVAALLPQLLKQGFCEMEMTNYHQSGRALAVLLSLSVERDQQGQAVGFLAHILDRSEHHRAQENLREMKNLYEQILDTIPDLVLCKGPGSKILYGNRAFREYYNMDVAQLQGLVDAPHQNPDYTQQYVQDDAYVFSTGQSLHIEEPVRRHDGAERIFSTIKAAIFDSQGQVVQTVGISRDITDQKQDELRVKQQEQFLRSVFEGSEHPIFVVDVMGGDGQPWTFRFVGWNRAAEVYVQIPRQEILGKTPIEVFGQDAGGLIQLRYEDCICQRSPIRYEEKMSLERGEVWWLTSLNPLVDDEGRVYRLVGTATEITGRKRAEMELQAYADRQALINQLTQQIRSSLDLETVLDSTLTAVRQLLRLGYCAFAWYEPTANPPVWHVVQESLATGVPTQLGGFPSDVVGPIVEPLMAGEPIIIDRAEDYPEPIHRQFLQDNGIFSEALIPIRSHRNGQKLGLLICAMEQQSQPWPASTVALLRVVGVQLEIAIDQAELYADSRQKSQELEEALRELKHTQVQIVQAEKMSSLGQLVAGVAHEINNPVNFIYGNLSHAKEYVDDLLEILGLYQHQFPDPGETITVAAEELDVEFLSADLPKLLNSMRVGAERIRGIVSSLRVFSRMDEAEVKAVDIHEGLDSTLVILQNRLKRQPDRPAIAVVKQYGDLPLVECYPGQLNQVFMNLLSNAIDALEEACQQDSQFLPQIGIQTQVDSVAHQVIIFVTDNGPGVPEELRSRIFDPFFTTKPVGKGTGMGLSISYQIITERHGGQIICEPVPSGGTGFTIAIPIQQPKAIAS